jgi:hypothetical protein
MSDVWRIASGTDDRTLDAWGVSSCVLTRRNYAADTLEFTLPQEDVLDEPAFAYGAPIRLTRNGQPYFIGRIIRQQQFAGAVREMHGYVAANAWDQLERTVYQQTRCIADATFDFSSYTPTYTPQAVLGQTELGGMFLTTTAQMMEVVTYAITRGCELVFGPLIGGVPFSREEINSLTCAEVLRRLGGMTPDSVMWMDYSGGVQTLKYGRRAALPTVSYDLLGGDRIVEFGGCEERKDLVPAGVRFIFIESVLDESETSDGLAYTRAVTQEAGLPDGPGGLIAAIEVQGEGTDAQAPIPIGLAAEYYLSLQTPPYEGRLLTQGADVLGDLRPGVVLNYSNGRAAWATMKAVVQLAAENILTGETIVEYGIPEQLSAQDFVDQLMFVRRVRLVTNLQGVRTCKIRGPDMDDDGEVAGTGEDETDNPFAGRTPRDYDASERIKRITEGQLRAGAGDGSDGTQDVSVCDQESGLSGIVRIPSFRVSGFTPPSP